MEDDLRAVGTSQDQGQGQHSEALEKENDTLMETVNQLSRKIILHFH